MSKSKKVNKKTNKKEIVTDMNLLKMYTKSSVEMITPGIENMSVDDFLDQVFLTSSDEEIWDMIKTYEKQLTVAVLDRDKFEKTLHSFFKDNADDIKKNNKYKLFFKFANFIYVKLQQCSIGMIDSYQNILLQQYAYLGGINCNIAGITTDGKLIKVPEVVKGLNEMNKRIYKACFFEKTMPKFSELKGILSKYGHVVQNALELDALIKKEQLTINSIYQMAYYIDENTQYIIPKVWRNPSKKMVFPDEYYSDSIYDEIRKELAERNSMLPTKGVVIKLKSVDLIDVTEVTLVEKMDEGSMVLLFNIKFSDNSETYGFYRTEEMLCYTTFEGSSVHKVAHVPLSNLVLGLYASLVSEKYINEDGTLVRKVYLGEELIDEIFGVRVSSNGPSKDNTFSREKLDKEKYMVKYKTIPPMIRKLPVGAVASDDAIKLAASYGIKLKDGETFVRDFSRKTYSKKS